MGIKEVFSKKKTDIRGLFSGRRAGEGEEIISCPSCGGKYSRSALIGNYRICPDCGSYLSVTPQDRIAMICDEGSFKRHVSKRYKADPLAFPGYAKKLELNRDVTGTEDAILAGTASIGGFKTVIAVMDTRFFMGSMGTALGEEVSSAAALAARKKLPLIIFCASGGARMQEGLFSLMQMAKTSAAIEKFKSAGGLYIPVLCNPTTGGVSASFAFLGDIILAEPGALIGFAGPRVIKQTIGQELPEGFQSAESQIDNGMIDGLLPRREARKILTRLLMLHNNPSAGAAALRKRAELFDEN